MHPIAKRAAAYLLILWVAGVMTAYFVFHKPWSGIAPIVMGRTLFGLALALALGSLAGGIGRVILGSRDGIDPLERLALTTGIGVGVLGFAVLSVGLLGFLTVWLAWAALIIGLIAVRRHILGWLGDLASITTGFRTAGRLPKSAAALATFLAAISLLEALAPPLKWDSLVYHLEFPKLYLQSGSVGFVEGNLFVGFPQLAEMNFVWAMALHDGSTAATLGWLVGLIGILGAAGYARRLFGAQGAYMLLAVLMSGVSLWQGLSWAYVDHWVLLYGTGMLIALDRFAAGRSNAWLLVAALYAGFALSTKYSSGVLLFFGSVLIFMAWWQDNHISSDETVATKDKSERKWPNFVSLTRDIVIFSTVAIVVAFPWFLKNAALTGNPVHPFLFPGREVDALRQAYHAQRQPDRTLANDTLLPLLATVVGVEGGPGFNTSISPLFVMLIPGSLLVFSKKEDRHRATIARLLVLSLSVWFVWVVGSHIADPLIRTRHYYGALPAMAVLAVAGFEYLSDLRLKELNVGWVISGLVAFSLLLTAIAAVFHLAQINPFPVLTGGQRRFDYLAEQLGWYGWTIESINELPHDSQVKFLWEPRTYYCQVDCRPDPTLDQWWYARRTIGGASAIANNWRDQGFTHVLIFDLGAELQSETQPLLSPEDWDELDRLRRDDLALAKDFGNVYSLYTLDP